jgi:REP element-mobilizing transposase RayT
MYKRSRLIISSLASKTLSDANLEIGDPRNTIRWHSRGYLPHFEAGETPQLITFHLSDSLPRTALSRMEADLNLLPIEKRDIARRRKLDALIDAAHGSCALGRPQVAKMMEGSILRFDSHRYRLFAWVVMPNHVHVLLQPLNDWTAALIVSSLKKYTARRIRAELGIGDETTLVPVWHREYWDRYIRNQVHFAKAMDYIHQNPVKARLVTKIDAWPWTSARFSWDRRSPDWRV